MTEAIQAIARAVGETGCYYLATIIGCSFHGGPKDVDVLALFPKALEAGVCDSTCFMKDPAKLAEMLTDRKWQVLKAGTGHELGVSYCIKPGEFEIIRYQRTPDKGETLDDCAHFVYGDGSGKCYIDPYGHSRCVAEGWVVSRRIFRPID